MSIAELVHEPEAQGLTLWFEGERVRFRAPTGIASGKLTLQEQACRIARNEVAIREYLRERAASRPRTCELSYAQQAIWFLHQQAPESDVHNISLVVRVLSTVDLKALENAVQALVDRHEILRTGYGVVDGVVCQKISGLGSAAFEARQISPVTHQELDSIVSAEHRRPLDLARGVVLRVSLLTLAEADHVLLVTPHHIAIDGWSGVTLVHELLTLYKERVEGLPAELNKPTHQYSDYCAWQSTMLAGPEGDQLWAYWQRKLAGPRSPLNLPTDRPRPPAKSNQGAAVRFLLEAATTERVKQLARREKTTVFVVLLACFHAFLFRLSGTKDITIGTPALGRKKPQFLRVLGDFINPLPLRASLSADMQFQELVRQLHRTAREGIDAQEFPFSLMVQRLQPERDPSRSPLFDCFFVLQRFHRHKEIEQLLYADEAGDVVSLGGLQLGAYPFNQQEGQFDLTLQVVERAGAFRATLKYSTDLFDEQTVRKFAADYASLVDKVTLAPESLLGSDQATRDEVSNRQPVSVLLDRLRASDIRLTVDGQRLRINAPKGAIDQELKALISQRRDEIIAALNAVAIHDDDYAIPNIRVISRTDPLPVSAAQRLFWFLDQLEPGRSHYNIGNSIRIRGPIDFEILQSAVNQLFARHESLRTRIGQRDGSPWAEILEPSGSALEIVDVSDLPVEAREAEAHRVAAAWMPKPFDLARGPLARTLVIRLVPDDHILVISIHHIVADGWSLAIAFKEICEFYDAGVSGRPPKLRDLPIQYVDYANWEQEQLKSGSLARHIEYWRKQLEGAPALLQLPTDRPRPAVQSFRGNRVLRHFEPSIIEELKTRSRECSATLFMTLLAAWQLLLHRYSGQNDIVVGSPVANRDLPAFEGVVGCLVNNVVLRSGLGGNPRFVDLLEQVKQTTLSAFDHRLLPFDVLVEALNPERSTSHAPIFQVLFTLLSYPMHGDLPAGLSFKMIDSYTHASRFDLTLELGFFEFGDHANELGALYEYRTDLFDEATILRLHEQFRAVLVAIVADPSFRIDDLPLLTAEDERLILEDWNATGRDHDRQRCVHDMLEDAARKTPDAPAVTANGLTLSYREFDGRANRLAHLLRERGVRPGDLVAVCLDRSVDVPVALAAVWKAGAAYVPLDPNHPEKRLQYIVEDAGISCAITIGGHAHLVKETGVPLIVLDQLQPDLEQLFVEPPDVRRGPDDLAYVIYTSGSTGQPKGVEVMHRNVVSFLEAMRREPGLVSSDVMLAVTTLGFDIAGLELWLPLCSGARVVIAAQADVLDGERLAAAIDSHQISVLQATPAVWRLLLESGWAGSRNLKALCGGEAMPRDLAGALVSKVGELWNMYGPTETTIWSTLSRLRDIDGPITIGRPIANTEAFVLEPNGLLAPIGVTGELCISGEGVARGYRNRPELTAEKFANIVLPNGRTARVYRTGDLARYRNDGQLEFGGRRDSQVKVRGHRIELGEVEAVLSRQSGIAECVVELRDLVPGDPRLVGYVTRKGDAPFDQQALRASLRSILPEYMIPDMFMVIPALPLTQNGKVDRKSLPTPKLESRADGAVALAMNPMQRRVADIWREVLSIDRVGLNENFFDVGGHSLLLTKLHARLKREFNTDMNLVELFQRTTVAHQAERLVPGSSSDAVLKEAQARATRQVHG